ncbi:protein with hydrophobic anchor [Listeria sp. PSOL-1]|uniref:protein with hydrophobic anchor n=1 Tax=Listeria sp. PSOL-1 TaxID=1844999 RepID=UPI0013D844E9|nr:protein with hydrophobic anchor [Listeria sp. PSOL-1]
MKKYIISILVVCLAFVAGCANITNTVKVNKNGTADINFDVNFDGTAAFLADSIMNKAVPQFKDQGFKVKKVSSTEYQFSRHIKQTTGGKNTNQLAKEYGINYKETKGFFFDKVRLDGTVDMPKLLKQYSGDAAIPNNILSQVNYTLVLDLPISGIGKNNADKVSGGKLTWKVPLTEKKPLFFEINVPNVKNIAIVGGIVLILAVALIIWLVRRKRKSSL